MTYNKIRIKKSNRGKFTDYCGGKVTSECISRGKNSPSAAVRKRATFAANARAWKHQLGGTLTDADIFDATKYYIGAGKKEKPKYWEIINPTRETAYLSSTEEDPAVTTNEDRASVELPTALAETGIGNWIQDLMFDESEETPIVQETNKENASQTEKPIDTTPSTFKNKEEFKTAMLLQLCHYGYCGETGQALVALMGLETRHGSALAGNFNYGNITAGGLWTGETAVRKDNLNGKTYSFRSYSDLQQGLQDYLRLIKKYDIKPGDSKDAVFAKLNGENPGKRRWAEALHYVKAMNDVYKSYFG